MKKKTDMEKKDFTIFELTTGLDRSPEVVYYLEASFKNGHIYPIGPKTGNRTWVTDNNFLQGFIIFDTSIDDITVICKKLEKYGEIDHA